MRWYHYLSYFFGGAFLTLGAAAAVAFTFLFLFLFMPETAPGHTGGDAPRIDAERSST